MDYVEAQTKRNKAYGSGFILRINEQSGRLRKAQRPGKGQPGEHRLR